MSSSFLCHSSSDKPFVRKLAQDLTAAGITVWLDEAEIKIGDSLIEKIGNGIINSQFMIAILSPTSMKSEWVQKELQIAMTQEISGRRIKVLPLLLADCELPSFLIDKVFADYRDESKRDGEFRKILAAMGITLVMPEATIEPTRVSSAVSSQPMRTEVAVAPHFPVYDPYAATPVKIIGINKGRTNKPDPRMDLHDVYFELSSSPSSGWKRLFEQRRSFPRHSMWRRAWISGSYIVCNCVLNEIERYHLIDLKEDVEFCNVEYARQLLNQKVREEMAAKRAQEEEEKKNNALDKLKF